MNILPRILTFLSHEKSQVTHVLNESLRIPQRLLASHIVPNRMLSYRNVSMGGNDFMTNDDLSLLQRNINKGIITRLKHGKNTRSSCETEEDQRRIEDHRQDSCEEPREWRSDGYQISKESYQKICDDLSSRSIESNSPICLDKPMPYNNRRECESSVNQCNESDQATVIECERWFCGKPATKGKIYYKCKPKLCVYSVKKEATCKPRDYCGDKSRQTTFCPDSEPSQKVTSNEKETCHVEIPKEQFARDTYEYYIKPDPPPPKCLHWSEELPSHYSKKTTRSTSVKSSPMIPEKGPPKYRAKVTASSAQNIHEDFSRSPNENERGKTDTKKAPYLHKKASKKCKPRCVISFEDKCADSLTLPVPVGRTTESNIQQFPKLTRDGRCCVKKPERKSVTSDIGDCNPNMASFKHRLSKCPGIKKMSGTDVKHEPPVDVSVQQKQGALLAHCKKTKRSESRQETAKRKRRKFKSRAPVSSGWKRQRYKIRLKIFQKGDGRLDPCLPRIAEVRQPRGEKMQPELLKSAADKGEFSSQSRRSCPHYSPSKMPIVETKSYPTKMDESRVIRDQYLEKHPCKKRR
ncbi:uncharacterized protein LOC114255171 [Monomorium pharaonis]|uniref:uncharacterized protein LOC114255171 n=1 Tax=Monomorium pharaonis TaxID=307658 RepID=UPI00102E186D|nr:uncharacterized protein LOC114255171 [Monomorium pharaonis]